GDGALVDEGRWCSILSKRGRLAAGAIEKKSTRAGERDVGIELERHWAVVDGGCDRDALVIDDGTAEEIRSGLLRGNNRQRAVVDDVLKDTADKLDGGGCIGIQNRRESRTAIAEENHRRSAAGSDRP